MKLISWRHADKTLRSFSLRKSKFICVSYIRSVSRDFGDNNNMPLLPIFDRKLLHDISTKHGRSTRLDTRKLTVVCVE